jgi:hypothetical protein
MRRLLTLLACAAALLPTSPAFAHPGGLDAEGCHTNRKTGDRHCHGAASATSSRASKPAAARVSTQGALRSGGAFSNCADARAAGAAPVRRGDPGYGPHLDRDNDGVGCEPTRR